MVLDLLLSLLESPFFIISLIFWIVTFALVKFLGKGGKKNVQFFFPFLALFKTQRLNRAFRRLANKHKRFWKIFWNIGIIVSFIFMIFALYFFTINLYSLIVDPKPENIVMPLIPGVTIGLPIFSYLILPLLFTITIHEFSHAIAAENDGVDVKSSGVFGAGIFFVIGFGAFVEVDEFQLYSRKYTSGTRLRVAAAGVWSNIIMAGVVLLLLSNFPTMMKAGYEREVFRVDTVLSNAQGGFNEGNLKPGDVVIAINGTKVDLNNQADLSSILENKTDVQCSIGDTLVFTCQDPDTKEEYDRSITLGFRYFVGFEFERYNETAFKIGTVHSALLGGNNENIIEEGTIITAFNNTQINYSSDQTFSQFLTQQSPNYKVNLTTKSNENIEINVNFYPTVPGAHVFHDIYLGIDTEKNSDDSIKITKVYDNEDESGINEGRIPEGTIITHVNGTAITLVGQTFKEFIKSNFSPMPGDILIFTDENGKDYTLQSKKIEVYSTFIGFVQEAYWLPSNFIGELFGGTFPNFLYIELMFTWMISFSIAIFNLLPTAIFDGGRLMKELVNMIIGSKERESGAKKKLRYQYDPEETEQHLMAHDITQVLTVQEIIPSDCENVSESSEEEEWTYRDLEFQALDTSKDEKWDSVEIIDPTNLTKESIIQVEVEYDKDLKEDKKKRINSRISWIVGLIVLANFLVSFLKFGNTFFWL